MSQLYGNASTLRFHFLVFHVDGNILGRRQIEVVVNALCNKLSVLVMPENEDLDNKRYVLLHRPFTVYCWTRRLSIFPHSVT